MGSPGYLLLFLLFVFAQICLCHYVNFKCPSRLEFCTCSNVLRSLTCKQTNKLPVLENIKFNSIELWDVSVENGLKNFTNITTDELIINGRANYFEDIMELFQLNFTSLHLVDVTRDIIEQIFQSNSMELKKFRVNLVKLGELNFDFRKFPNLENITIGDLTQNRDIIEKIGSNVFEGLNFLSEIDLGNSGIKELAENSLVFTSEKEVKLNLAKNEIDADDLVNSNLSNMGGLDVNLASNEISSFPAKVFEKFFQDDSSKTEIILGDNPIHCKSDQVTWVLKYEHVKAGKFPVSKARCVDLNKDLSQLNHNDLDPNGKTPTSKNNLVTQTTTVKSIPFDKTLSTHIVTSSTIIKVIPPTSQSDNEYLKLYYLLIPLVIINSVILGIYLYKLRLKCNTAIPTSPPLPPPRPLPRPHKPLQQTVSVSPTPLSTNQSHSYYSIIEAIA